MSMVIALLMIVILVLLLIIVILVAGMTYDCPEDDDPEIDLYSWFTEDYDYFENMDIEGK